MQRLSRSESVFLTAIAVVLFLPTSLYAAQGEQSSIAWGTLILGMVGGLAFFLYGMEKMSEGMKRSAGNRMRAILSSLTQNRVVAMGVGAFVTMVIQSSSATTVMLVSFVQAELMTFTQSLGVILGADIGTTITAQMVAFKLTDYALAMVAAGFSLRMFGKTDNIRSIGDIVLGFGILFFGMKLMSDTMAPLRSYPDFINMMKSLENPLMGILAGAVFTAVVQSSSATTGVVIVLAQQGLVSLEAGIPIILGANIGTCVTAGLASIGTQREAKRVALAHVMFKIVGVLLIVPFIQPFSDLIRYVGEQFGSGTARQIANAHTAFNIGIGLLFLPFVDLFAKLIFRLLPEKPREKGLDPATWHLDDKLIATPAIALQLATAEIARMAKILGRMHRAAMIPFVIDKPQQDEIYPQQLTLLQGIDMRRRKIDFLESRIRRYLLDISRQELVSGQGREVSSLISLLDSMQRISEVVTGQIVPLLKVKEQTPVDFTEEGKKELIEYHEKVGKQLDRLQQMISNMDASLARKVSKKKDRYASFDSRLRLHHLKRMLAMKEASVETHSIHMELMDALNHINIYSAEIADTLLQGGALVTPDQATHSDDKGDDNKAKIAKA